MLETDITYSYDTRGYMMYYKGNPIGGAGIAKSAKGCRANLKLFREQAAATKRELLLGRGSKYMLDEIAEIDRKIKGEI